MNGWRTMVVVLALLGAASAQAKCKIEYLQMAVRMEGTRAIATLGINGTQIPMVVDTGAFYSNLTRASAEQLGLELRSLPFGFTVEGLAGRMQDPRRTTVPHVQFLGGELPDVEFLVGGNDSGLGGMGLMGRNILSVFDTEYDLAHGMIRFVMPNADCGNANMAYWAGDTPVSEIALIRENRDIRDRRDKTPAIRAVVKVNGHDTVALFDSGASTIVSLHAAKSAGVGEAALEPLGDLYGVGKGRVKGWTAAFDSVALGDETVRHNRLEVSDFDARDFDMLVGIDFFLSHHIYVSKKRARMFFTYNGGPVFSRNASEKPAGPASAPEGLSADELFRRGSASLSRNELATALADLDRACALEPGNASFHATRAAAHARMKDFPQALADFDAALALDPRLDEARLQRAWLPRTDAGHAKALDDLAFLDDKLPPQSNLRAGMARRYDDLGLPSAAIRQWTLWIANHPDDIMVPGAKNARCWGRMVADIELDKALADCNDAIDDDGKDVHRRDSRGWLYLRLDKAAKARADFDIALAAKPAAAWSLYGRALAHQRLGEAAAAQADLAAARAAEPKIDEKVKAIGFDPAP